MAEMVSGLTGTLQGSVTGIINKGQNWLDRLMPPERRNELIAKASKFATEKPALASFLLSQVALSGLPLGLFIIMTITVVVFSLLAGLLIGLIGALLFIVVAIGFALVILLPTLFITTFAAAFIWLWGMGAYYILKWFNQKEIPGIHKPLSEGTSLDAITGAGKQPGDANGDAGEKKEGGGGKKEMNGHAAPEKKKQSGEKGKSSGVELPDAKKAAEVGNIAGKTGDLGKAKDVAGGAKGAVSGVTGGLG